MDTKDRIQKAQSAAQIS